MELLVKNSSGIRDIVTLSPEFFNVKYNESLLHQIVLFYSYNSHVRTKSQKTRSEVSGGGIKPWRQKGTGRARAGSIRSPLWRGGGKIFAARGLVEKRKKINKKMYKLGIKVIFSELIRQNRITVIDSLFVNVISTKEFLNSIKYLNISERSLFIVDEFLDKLFLSSRNLKNVSILFYAKISPVVLMKSKNIFITKKALILIEETFK